MNLSTSLRLTAMAICTFAVIGCQNAKTSSAKTKEVVMTDKKTAEVVEPLKELSRDAKGVTVRVYTGGCTEKSHFVWKKTPDQPKGAPIELTLYRTTNDKCYANIPEGMVITYDYQELGVAAKDTFTVGNPIQMPGIDPDA